MIEQKQNILFYGLDKERKAMEKYFRSLNTLSYHKIYTIDKYNNELYDTINGKDSSLLYGQPEKLRKFAKTNWLTHLAHVTDWPLWEKYYQLTCQEEKFNFTNLATKIEKEYAPELHVSELEYFFIKRGCKIGLAMAKNGSDVKIYFCLDNMNINDVVFKIKSSEDSVTNSELRYIYRNWSELKGNILFFKNNKPVLAPWDEYPRFWNRKYVPKSMKDKNVDQKKEVKVLLEQAMKEQKAINKFSSHSISNQQEIHI
jgi:hypothetical protein